MEFREMLRIGVKNLFLHKLRMLFRACTQMVKQAGVFQPHLEMIKNIFGDQ